MTDSSGERRVAREDDLSRGLGRTDALALFDASAPVPVDRLTGFWRGGEVPTGHPLDGLLDAYGWVGKRLDDPETVHPLLFDVGRGSFALNPAGLPLGLALRCSGLLHRSWVVAAARCLMPLRRTTRPRARLRAVDYRGVVSAAMVYDALPVIDHFRALDDQTLIGAMDLRGMDAPFVFTLRR